MFCPSCKDEFRPGFTRCEGCGVDLIEDLSAAPPVAEPAAEAAEAAAVALRALPMVDYCGFFALDEVRGARTRLKAEGIHSDIVIRESPDAVEQNSHGEEYWLRVDAAKYRRVAPILGFDSAESADGSKSRSCEACGEEASRDAAFCARCGMRFEDR